MKPSTMAIPMDLAENQTAEPEVKTQAEESYDQDFAQKAFIAAMREGSFLTMAELVP